MFEGKPPRPEQAGPLDGPSEGHALRPLEWAELASRLAAARELRASLHSGDAEGEASFDPCCARRIAAHRDGKEPVNPDDSADRKAVGGTRSEALPAGRDGARGN